MLRPMRLIASARLVYVAAMVSTAAAQDAEFRAFWVDGWHDGIQNVAEVARLVSDIRAVNGNAIFVQARRRGDALYASPCEPKCSDVSSNLDDPLGTVIATSHDTNSGTRIEVHAWFVTYPVASGFRSAKATNTAPLIAEKAKRKHPLALHPDWLTESDAGEQFDGRYYAFDPGHPEVQKYLFELAMDIIRRYDVDGFHFDHVRYTSSSWGYNKAAVARFNSLFRRSGRPACTDPDWLQFRRDQVTALVRKIYLSAIALKPSLKISASTITWAPGIASDERWPESMACKTALQDWRAWMEEGILDINVPMVFFDRAGPSFSNAFADWNSYAKNHKYNRHVIIGLGASMNRTPDTLAQLRAARGMTIRRARAEGVALYSYAVPTRDESQKTAFFAALSSGANPGAGSPGPFERRVPVPPMPWKTRPTTGHLLGRVGGPGESAALDGGQIILTGPAKRRLTADATGFYGAVDLPPGGYSVVASFPGRLSATNTCAVRPGEVAVLDFALAR
jgi:uncharacterized lipoprotein YddW (UPF0748 family)